MRKFFRFSTMALVAVALVACDKEDKPQTPDDGGEDFKEITLSCSVDLMEGIETSNYGTGEMTMPGDKILEFFGMTAKEFYKAMGSITGTAPSTSQVDNTISFGVCTGNDHDKMNFCPMTTTSLGCWMTAESAVTTWGEDAVFYHESYIEWGLEEPSDDMLADMWTFGVGFYPGHNEYKAGDKIKATYFFYKEAEDDDEVDLYCYVEMVINIVAAEEVNLTVKKTANLRSQVPFDAEYIHYSINDLPVEDIQAEIGVAALTAKAYGVNPDGTYTQVAGNNFWFMKDGTVGNWGEGAALDMNNNEQGDSVHWAFCMFPDSSLAGTTINGAIGFANEDGDVYVVKLAVAVAPIEE